MRLSTDRILTTHVGSLPRSQELVDQLFAKDAGEAYDSELYDGTVREAVRQVIALQVDAGVDVPSDGEQSKVSYSTYMTERLTGFGGDTPGRMPADHRDHPEFKPKIAGTRTFKRAACIGPVAVRDLTALDIDIANLVEASKAAGVQESFLNSGSPGLITAFQPNQYYPSHEAYLEAAAEAMTEEYDRIVGAGLILQLDCPDLAMAGHIAFQDLGEAEFLKRVDAHVEAMNHALRNVPAERVRMHICWGNYEGPHDHDIDVAKVMPALIRAKPAGILFEAANVRHEHEWTVWRDAKLPDQKVLIPGLIDSCSNYVEHPELVAQRIERFAAIVGRERVIAGTDCGFGTFAGYGNVVPSVVWKKLEALSDGAAIASRRLWASASSGRPTAAAPVT